MDRRIVIALASRRYRSNDLLIPANGTRIHFLLSGLPSGQAP